MRTAPLAAALLLAVFAAPGAAQPAQPNAIVAAICGIVSTSARAEGLPVAFLTRLVWQESRFRSDVVSPAGARGIAQFMPGTAEARGLADPFDPEAAIPAAAKLLAEYRRQFGNLGLAAAAYNAGPGAVASYLSGRSTLPGETQAYVRATTLRPLEDWRDSAVEDAPGECEQVVEAAPADAKSAIARSALLAPWGVEVAASFDKSSALRAFGHVRSLYWTVVKGVRPIVIGMRLQGRRRGLLYRVRAPARTRGEADLMCNKLETLGVRCTVERS